MFRSSPFPLRNLVGIGKITHCLLQIRKPPETLPRALGGGMAVAPILHKILVFMCFISPLAAHGQPQLRREPVHSSARPSATSVPPRLSPARITHLLKDSKLAAFCRSVLYCRINKRTSSTKMPKSLPERSRYSP